MTFKNLEKNKIYEICKEKTMKDNLEKTNIYKKNENTLFFKSELTNPSHRLTEFDNF